ncbi:putative colanic biosynthesis UDP-glucose lipid carrier transferase [Candidatus Photodesmus blepharus]|uniref:Putative colanic biosynthesis UDP-glucose lipid carrier transferase n=1 Tax=Candidatus Photodesmus blepharonis TaxID=1179155 RepID=A0A084CPL1_9GAMM|nr:sugar transferase [Candidatus Photodesmus blepharus]KEY91740.1 putative colanic biosynthesis UDP-glucose lipid carrier transferase [Candidatus Photodesmus blepharus]
MTANKSTRISIYYGKRIFDLLTACSCLILLSPIILSVGLIIKANSDGSIFYKQLRVGKSTSKKIIFFKIIKFRTMYQNSERYSGAIWATKNDPRITSVGHFLRKTRFDEIPQLVNVIKGEMSLIGPRPERPIFYNKLENAIPFFSERTYGVLPGITGLAQINQGYDTCVDDVRHKVGFDHSYALSLSSIYSWVVMDINIITKTIVLIFDRKGQ